SQPNLDKDVGTGLPMISSRDIGRADRYEGSAFVHLIEEALGNLDSKRAVSKGDDLDALITEEVLNPLPGPRSTLVVTIDQKYLCTVDEEPSPCQLLPDLTCEPTREGRLRLDNDVRGEAQVLCVQSIVMPGDKEDWKIPSLLAI